MYTHALYCVKDVARKHGGNLPLYPESESLVHAYCAAAISRLVYKFPPTFVASGYGAPQELGSLLVGIPFFHVVGIIRHPDDALST
jgi:hypothetical protein